MLVCISVTLFRAGVIFRTVDWHFGIILYFGIILQTGPQNNVWHKQIYRNS